VIFAALFYFNLLPQPQFLLETCENLISGPKFNEESNKSHENVFLALQSITITLFTLKNVSRWNLLFIDLLLRNGRNGAIGFFEIK
jgi:hypothetical protein